MVKTSTVSLKRRTLMISGAAAVVIPAGWLCTTRAKAAEIAAAKTLVASGRITGADGKALAGATVHSWYLCTRSDGQHACTVTTDADGRFVFKTIAPAVTADGIQPLHVFVRHPSLPDGHHVFVGFERDASLFEPVIAQSRVEHDTLRASFALTVA